MTLQTTLGPHEFELNGELYELLDMGGGQVQWTSAPIPGQPGDSVQVKSAPVTMHGGFGSTHRIRLNDGRQSDPNHHHYAENVVAMHEGVVYPAPRITYLDLSSLSPQRRAFRVGGYANSVVGGNGAGIGAVGGGSFNVTPQYIREFGSMLYVHAGPYTFTVDPDQTTPTVVEGHYHGASARAVKSDVFGNALAVALGAGQNADFATIPYSSAGSTQWSSAAVARDGYTVGPAGRLFSWLANKVYNVLPGADALLSAAYLPSNGETITDVSNPVRAVEEFTSALVAGTARSLRTLDPNRGYQGVPVTAESRLSASEYDGRALLSIGTILFSATKQAVQMIQAGRLPVQVGPETLALNNSPYKGMEWGIPDFLGNLMAWPAYIPDTGDSVIFFAKVAYSGDQGLERFISNVEWHDALFLDGREVRCVRYWGGSSTRKPRIFFGAGTTANPYQVGWCDWGVGGGPIPYTCASTAQPATSGFIETALDDLNLPGVTKVLERVEIPMIHGADANNYVVVQGRGNHSGSFTNLVKDQTGVANNERITSENFGRVFGLATSPISGVELALKFTFTQASAAVAANWLQLHGSIMLYYTEVPNSVQLIDTVIDAKTDDLHKAEELAARLRTLYGSVHKRARFGPDGSDRYVKVTAAKVQMHELNDGKSATRLGIALQMREVLTA